MTNDKGESKLKDYYLSFSGVTHVKAKDRIQAENILLSKKNISLDSGINVDSLFMTIVRNIFSNLGALTCLFVFIVSVRAWASLFKYLEVVPSDLRLIFTLIIGILMIQMFKFPHILGNFYGDTFKFIDKRR